MTKILVLEKPEEKLRRERERLLGELSVYGERLAFLQDTVDEIKEMIEYYDGAIKSLERLREKEIEQDTRTTIKDSGGVDKGKFLIGIGYKYLARDMDNELWAHKFPPKKGDTQWVAVDGDYIEKINTDIFQEVKWTDNEPTKISKLLATYQNGGENGK